MKKIMFTLLFSFPMLVQAEELRFITVLSSPVGTFNRVEEVDTQTPVTSPVINFCTHLGSGSIRLNGNANPTVAEMTLSNGTTLGGNVSEYRLQSLTMKDRGTLNGSRLLANTVNANTIPTLVRSSNIYANTLTVQGAKTKGLNVGDGKSVMSELGKYKGKDKPEMVWSNEYQQDKNGTTSTVYAKQFLLKSKGSFSVEDCSSHTYKLAHKSECCPSLPKTDTECWTSLWTWSELRTNVSTENLVSSPQMAFAEGFHYPSQGTDGINKTCSRAVDNPSGSNTIYWDVHFNVRCASTVKTGGSCTAQSVCFVNDNPSYLNFCGKLVYSGSEYATYGAKDCMCQQIKFWKGRECELKYTENGW